MNIKISLQYSLFSMKLGYLSPILEQRLNAEKKKRTDGL